MDSLVYDTSLWTELLFEEEVADNQRLLAAVENDTKKKNGGINAWPMFVREMFGRTYGTDRELLEEPAAESDWARVLHEKLDGMPEWQRAMEVCEGDEWLAGQFCAEIAPVLRQALPKGAPEDAGREADELEALKGLAEDHDSVKLQQMIREQSKKVTKARRANRKFKKAIEEMPDGQIEAQVRSDMKGMNDELEEKCDAMEGLGFGREPGKPGQRSVRKLVANNKGLRKIVNLAGRFRAAARGAQLAKASAEMASIEQGSQLERLIPTEYMQLGTPLGSALIYSKMLEGSALQYELQDKGAERGPIIFAVDESGSMNWVWEENSDKIDAFMVAKACMLGMMKVAAIQKRPFAVMHWGSGQHDESWSLLNKKPTEEQVLKAAAHNIDGGTNSLYAIQRCCEMIRNGKLERHDYESEREEGAGEYWEWDAEIAGKADIILFTDAQDYFAIESVRASLKEAKASLYTVHTGERLTCEKGSHAHTLKELSEEYITIETSELDASEVQLGKLFAM